MIKGNKQTGIHCSHPSEAHKGPSNTLFILMYINWMPKDLATYDIPNKTKQNLVGNKKVKKQVFCLQKTQTIWCQQYLLIDKR